MILDNYIIPRGYDLGKLDNTVYLYPLEAKETLKFDNDSEINGICSDIQGDAISMWCENVSVNADASTDGRYSFTKEMTLTIVEQKNETYYKAIETLISGEWIVAFKNRTGDSFIFNSDFAPKVEYSYTFSDDGNGNVCSISIKVVENSPIWAFKGVLRASESLRDKNTCLLNNARPVELFLIDVEKCKVQDIEDNFILYTDNKKNLMKIEWLEGSVSYTDELVDGVYHHRLAFSIPFKDWQYYFHYNLIEYLNNKYYMVLRTSNGNTILGGNRFGLMPSYSVSTSDATGTPNMINIILEVSYTTYNTLLGVANTEFDNLAFIRKSENYAVLAEECIGGYKVATLLEKYTNGTPTGVFYCLEGYETKYKDKNIKDTYTSSSSEFDIKLKVRSEDCEVADCVLDGAPSSIYISSVGYTNTYILQTNCNILEWSGCTYADVDISKVANLRYEMNVRGLQEGSCYITIETESVKKTIPVTVFNKDQDEDTKTIYITAKAQEVYADSLRGTKDIKEIIYDGTVINSLIYKSDGTGFIFNCKENDSTASGRRDTVKVIYNDGSMQFITIIQDLIHTKYVTSGYMCDGVDLYNKVGYYSGYTDDTMVLVEYQKGQLRERNSDACDGGEYVGPSGSTQETTIYKWVETEETTCIESSGETNCIKSEYVDTRDGKKVYANYISYMCDDEWKFIGYSEEPEGDIPEDDDVFEFYADRYTESVRYDGGNYIFDITSLKNGEFTPYDYISDSGGRVESVTIDNDKLTVKFRTNSDTSEKTGTITLRQVEGKDGVRKEIKINYVQEAKPVYNYDFYFKDYPNDRTINLVFESCAHRTDGYYSIGAKEQTVYIESQTKEGYIEYIEYEIIEKPEWISVQKTGRKLNICPINWNESTKDKTGRIILRQNESNYYLTINVTHLGAVYEFSVDKELIFVDSLGGDEIFVNVTSKVEYCDPWSEQLNDVGWTLYKVGCDRIDASIVGGVLRLYTKTFSTETLANTCPIIIEQDNSGNRIEITVRTEPSSCYDISAFRFNEDGTHETFRRTYPATTACPTDLLTNDYVYFGCPDDVHIGDCFCCVPSNPSYLTDNKNLTAVTFGESMEYFSKCVLFADPNLKRIYLRGNKFPDSESYSSYRDIGQGSGGTIYPRCDLDTIVYCKAGMEEEIYVTYPWRGDFGMRQIGWRIIGMDNPNGVDPEITDRSKIVSFRFDSSEGEDYYPTGHITSGNYYAINYVYEDGFYKDHYIYKTRAFYFAISEVTIGEGITYIGHNSFSNQYLKKVIFKGVEYTKSTKTALMDALRAHGITVEDDAFDKWSDESI